MAEFKHGKDTADELNKTKFEWVDLHTVDGTNFSDVVLISKPPSGYYKVVNIYVEKVGVNYKLKVEHEDTPEP